MIKEKLKRYILILIICLPILTKADVCFRTFEQDTSMAQAIFVGKVVKIQKSQFWYGEPKTIFTFEIKESFKGIWKEVGYISLIGPIRGCCNVNFLKDSTYLVFAYGDCENSTLLWTNDCSNTGLFSESKMFYQMLGNSTQHDPDPEYLKYINASKTKADSLLYKIEHLNYQVETIEKENFVLKHYVIILCLIIFSTGIFITLKLIIKRKIKTNINNT